MRMFVSIAIVLLPIAASSAEVERNVDSAECKDITARIIESTGARFDHFSPVGNDVFFDHPGTQSISLSCATHRLTGVSIVWDKNSFPPNAWFNLVARSGNAVTGASLKRLTTALHACHRAALRDADNLSNVELPPAKIECSAFTRDGGGVFMSVWVNDHEARKGVEE